MNCARRCGQTGQAEYARISRRPAAVFALVPALSAAMPIPAQITPQEHLHQMSHGVMPFDMSKKVAATAARYPSRSKVIWSRPWSATARIAVARGTCCGLCHVRSSSCTHQRQICPPIPLTSTSSGIIFFKMRLRSFRLWQRPFRYSSHQRALPGGHRSLVNQESAR